MSHPGTLSSVFTLCSLLVVACGGGPSPQQDAGPSDLGGMNLPACAEPVGIFPLDARGEAHPLGAPPEVPVILGFQGFLFVQFALRSPFEVSGAVPLRTRLRVGSIDRQTSHPDLTSLPVAGGAFDTRDITVFFNDFALGDLVGRPVTIELYATMRACLIELHADATLVDGNNADAGVLER